MVPLYPQQAVAPAPGSGYPSACGPQVCRMSGNFDLRNFCFARTYDATTVMAVAMASRRIESTSYSRSKRPPAAIVAQIAQACAATGMIFAMHQIQLASLVRHGHANPWARAFLQRAAVEQSLVASSTTEGKAGGDLAQSECAVEAHGSTFTLRKSATVVS